MSSSHSGWLAGKSLGLTQSPCSRQRVLSPAVAAVCVTTAPDGPAPITNTSTTSCWVAPESVKVIVVDLVSSNCRHYVNGERRHVGCQMELRWEPEAAGLPPQDWVI